MRSRRPGGTERFRRYVGRLRLGGRYQWQLAVVGAYATDSGGYWTGSAYVYTRSGTVWTQRARLTPPDPLTEREQFGQAVAVDARTVAIGALGHGVSGSVFVAQQ